MELHPGTCGVCSNYAGEVVNPEDADIVWEKISSIFGDEIDNLSDLRSTVSLCSTCVLQIALINSRRELLKNIGSCEKKSLSMDSCVMCTDSTLIYKVENSSLQNLLKSYLTEETKCTLPVCAVCYYMVEARSTLVQKLTQLKIPRSCKSRRYSTRENHDTVKRENTVDLTKTNTDENIDNSNSFKKSRESSDDIIVVSDVTLENSSLYQNRASLKRKASKSPVKENVKKIKQTNSNQKHVDGFDISKILYFEPLCKSKIKMNDDSVKEDSKFYNSIPYIQLSHIKPDQLKKNILKKVIGTSQDSPTNSTRRTPPIKIRLKPERKIVLKLTKDTSGKNNNHKAEVISTIIEDTPVLKKQRKNSSGKKGVKKLDFTPVIEDMTRRKVIVKVERIDLTASENETSELTTQSTNQNNSLTLTPSKNESTENNDNYILKPRTSNLKDFSREETTPKKKKKVHFNDTPTIIVTEDEIMEDFSLRIEDDDEEERNETTNGELPEVSEVASENLDSDVEDVENVEKEKTVTENESIELDSDSSVEEVSESVVTVDDAEKNIKKNGDSASDVLEVTDDENDVGENVNDTPNEEVISETSEKQDDEEIETSDKDENDESEHPKEAETNESDKEENTSSEKENDAQEANRETQNNESDATGEKQKESDEPDVSNKDSPDPQDPSNEDVAITEDFGSLIDEVQKCLTSNKELSSNSDEEVNDRISDHDGEADKVEKTADKVEKTADKVEKTADKVEKTADKVEKTADKVEKTPVNSPRKCSPRKVTS